jgi:hypothetical protein
MYLQRGDTIKIQVGNKNPKGKAWPPVCGKSS